MATRLAMLGQAAGARRLRRAAAASIGRSTCCIATAGRCVGLLDVVHTSFGRLMGREHVNCVGALVAASGACELCM